MSSMSSMPTEIRTSPAVTPRRLTLLLGDRGVGHGGRMRDQRLDAAEALAEGAQAHLSEEGRRAVERPEVERDHRAEAGHLLLRERVLRVGREARIVHLRIFGCLARWSATARPFDSCRSMRTTRVLMPRRTSHESIGREDRARAVLDERQPLDVLLRLRDRGSADRVGVAAEKLRRRVHDDVGAERERLLEVRRGEGVVDDDDGAVAVGELREGGDVGRSASSDWSAIRGGASSSRAGSPVRRPPDARYPRTRTRRRSSPGSSCSSGTCRRTSCSSRRRGRPS